MKLLILTNNMKRASFRQRIGIYMDSLRADGIECDAVQLPSGSMGRSRAFAKAGAYDVIFLQKKRLNVFDAFWLSRNSRHIIYDFDDAIMYDDKFPDEHDRKRQRSFERSVRIADTVIAGNKYLFEHASRLNSKVSVIPTGLDIHEYDCAKRQLPGGKIRLVWIGSGSTLAYLDGIRDALEEIGRRHNNVVMRIISDQFVTLDNMQVEQCPWSLEDQAARLKECDVGLAPLRDDRFTRGKCGFKILQYQAAGLAVVAAPVGVNREFVKDGINGYCASGGKEWIERIEQLVIDPELRSRLGVRGRSDAASFDLHVILRKLVEVIKNTAD